MLTSHKLSKRLSWLKGMNGAVLQNLLASCSPLCLLYLGKHSVPGESGQDGELHRQGPRAGQGRNSRLPFRDATVEVHRPVRNALQKPKRSVGRVEGGGRATPSGREESFAERMKRPTFAFKSTPKSKHPPSARANGPLPKGTMNTQERANLPRANGPLQKGTIAEGGGCPPTTSCVTPAGTSRYV